ncbi:hypothetical protein ABG067_007675 [Albugo candida]|uniref:Uncharacterized protein n=1 Tax=Albugo candida TaxID=65357 RepID=A0A024FU14_9STRA|nr:unnamed protein product [Albugo candida]|eukprot:CCI10496.1 unnamed protein product [Albugo candida]
MTTKIGFQARRATGKSFKCNGTHRETQFEANKEIIYSGGAINSTLTAIKVGDADHLKKLHVLQIFAFNTSAQSQLHCIMLFASTSNVSSCFDLITSRPNWKRSS